MLVLALGIAVGSAAVFGVSMALGAFLAGMVVGRSDFSLRAATEALPMRDAFAVLFFVSVGMLLDPRALLRVARAGRGDAGRRPGRQAAGRDCRRAAAALSAPRRARGGVALAQIGEFSFILAALAQQLGLLPAEAMNTLVAASIVSIVLNPLLYRLPAVIRAPRHRSRRRPSRRTGCDVDRPLPRTARSSSATGRPGAP